MRPEVVAVTTRILRVVELRVLCTEVFGTLLIHCRQLFGFTGGLGSSQLQTTGDGARYEGVRRTRFEVCEDYVGHRIGFFYETGVCQVFGFLRSRVVFGTKERFAYGRFCWLKHKNLSNRARRHGGYSKRLQPSLNSILCDTRCLCQ